MSYQFTITGLLSPEQTMLTRTSHALLSVVTMTVERNKRLVIDARDEFDNKCAARLTKDDLERNFLLRVSKVRPVIVFTLEELSSSEKSVYALKWRFFTQ